MLKVTIIHVGTIKERYLTDAVAEYEKRLSAYCSVANVNVRDERLPERPSAAEINAAVKKEGERVLAAVPPRAFLVSLCVEGKMLSSEQLAERISKLPSEGFSELCLVIGGSDGLSDAVKSRSHLRLSFSPMTFPHQLMRVLLLEQLYRSFNISSGGRYHK